MPRSEAMARDLLVDLAKLVEAPAERARDALADKRQSATNNLVNLLIVAARGGLQVAIAALEEQQQGQPHG